MTSGPKRRQYGRGWLELAVIAGVIAAIAWFGLEGLHELQSTSEKTIVDLTVRNMRTGLQLRIGELMLANRAKEIPQLAGQNPVQWLAKPPEGYVGELDTAPAKPMARSWYFNRRNRTLVYRSGTDDDAAQAWRIETVNGNPDGGVAGAKLIQLPP